VVSASAGTYNITSTAWVELDTALRVVLPARAGQLVRVSFLGVWGSAAFDGLADAVIVTSGLFVSQESTSAGALNGCPAWYGQGGYYRNFGGTMTYQLTPADIAANGLVTLTPYVKIGATGSKELLSIPATRPRFEVEVVGHPH
jgi:hypothetical protein